MKYSAVTLCVLMLPIASAAGSADRPAPVPAMISGALPYVPVDSTSKCTTESALDDFSWRAVAEAFARSIIQIIHDERKFVHD